MSSLENILYSFLGNTDADGIFRSVLNNIPYGIMVQDKEGRTTFVNSNFTELIGYSPEEIVGLGHQDTVNLLVGKYHSYDLIAKSWQKVKMGETLKNRRRFVHKQGYTVPLEISAHPIHSLNGEFRGEILVLKDLHQELLFTVTNLVNSTRSLKDVLHHTTIAAVEHLGLQSNAIFLADETGQRVILHSCNLFDEGEDLSHICFEIGEGPPGKIFKEQKPVYVRDLKLEESLPEESRVRMSHQSSIGYPLICKDELIGVIAFDADTVREFSEREKALFQNIANQVALAIYNAQMFSRLEHMSITDGLTGLHNHRYFQGRLAEIEETRSVKQNHTLLMVDVDNFKNYNDTLGHVNGDVLLKELAQLIKRNVRQFDIVARYGGEEFAVILMNCPKEEARIIAERIRLAVEDYEFYGREYQPRGRVTVSIGLAAYEQVGNKDELLLSADKALYHAKERGRNRVEEHIA